MISGNLNQNLTIWPYVAFDQIYDSSDERLDEFDLLPTQKITNK